MGAERPNGRESAPAVRDRDFSGFSGQLYRDADPFGLMISIAAWTWLMFSYKGWARGSQGNRSGINFYVML
jgi:hypothetical protein